MSLHEQESSTAGMIVMAVAEDPGVQILHVFFMDLALLRKPEEAPVSYSIRNPSVSISRLSLCSAAKQSLGNSFSIRVVI